MVMDFFGLSIGGRRELEMTLKEGTHHLIDGLENAKEDTHAAVSRPFLIKSLYQIRTNPFNVSGARTSPRGIRSSQMLS